MSGHPSQVSDVFGSTGLPSALLIGVQSALWARWFRLPLSRSGARREADYGCAASLSLCLSYLSLSLSLSLTSLSHTQTTCVCLCVCVCVRREADYGCTASLSMVVLGGERFLMNEVALYVCLALTFLCVRAGTR